MNELANEVIPLIQRLIPGFLMTMAFYWFAEVPKPSQFERTLQALVGTAVIQVAVIGVERLALWIGFWHSFGEWTATTANVYAMAIGLSSGLLLAYCCNRDLIYSLARRLHLTTKASMEDSIHVYQKLGQSGVVLNFIDGRRLMGYIEAFPNNKESGSFLMSQPCWVTESEIIPCTGTHCMLISNTDVQWVEFLD